MRALFIACALVAALAAQAGADILTLTDGRVLDGEVQAELEKVVHIEVTSPVGRAVIEVPRKEIRSWERTERTGYQLLLNAYGERVAEAQRRDGVRDWHALADWADDHQLRDEALAARYQALLRTILRAPLADQVFDAGRRAAALGLDELVRAAYERALTLDPGHAPSHRALGHQQFQGKWLTPTAYELAVTEHYRSQGYIRVDGEWREPQQVLDELEAAAQRLSELEDQLEAAREELNAAEEQADDGPKILLLQSAPRTYRDPDCGILIYSVPGRYPYGYYGGSTHQEQLLHGYRLQRLGRTQARFGSGGFRLHCP